MADSADSLWRSFLSKKNLPPDTGYAGDLCFDSDPFSADSKVLLALTGAKSAFFASYAQYRIDGTEPPVSGEYYILFDAAENPRCVIELTSVQVLPLNAVTWEMARLEGEDESLSAWHEKMHDILETEAAISGFLVTDDMPIVFCTFQVVFTG